MLLGIVLGQSSVMMVKVATETCYARKAAEYALVLCARFLSFLSSSLQTAKFPTPSVGAQSRQTDILEVFQLSSMALGCSLIPLVLQRLTETKATDGAQIRST